MKKNRKEHNNFSFIKLISFLLLIIVIFLTYGFSTYSDNLAIGNSKARVMKDAVVRITNASANTNSNSGQINYIDFSADKIYTDINLPNANSTVTLDVTVTNFGNVEMGISSITGLPSNLTYTLTGYNLETALCDSNDNRKCTLGSETNFQITIAYDTNGFDGITNLYSLNLEFVFHEMVYTARINNNYYETIQDAIDASPTDGTETTIVLLKNVYQRIKIWRGNNIVLDMDNLVLHNPAYTNNLGDPVIEIFGARDKAHSSSDNTNNVGVARLKMINGSIISDANQGAINVELGGEFIMTGGSITTTGNRQSVYIKNGGRAEIGGTAHLSSIAQVDLAATPPNYRGTVHNYAGTLVITGGTFEAVGTDGIALTSESTTTIGTEDGTVNTTSPTFIGEGTGIHIKASTTFNFYDGVAKGKKNAIVNENEIDDIENGYNIVHTGQTINGNVYAAAFLANNGVTLTFAPDGGSVSEITRLVVPNSPVGPLPIPTRNEYNFDYWYDSNGFEVGPNSTINTNTTYTAHWTPLSAICYARINRGNNDYTDYTTLSEAVSAVPNNTQTVIELLRETTEKVTIANNKNIIFDFNSYKLSNPDNNPIITNNGTLEFKSGTINMTGTGAVISNNKNLTISGGTIRTSSNNTSAINNNANATLTMTGGNITATGSRQAIYDDGGTVTISGTAELISSAKFEGTSKPRATVQANAATSNITILGGLIVSNHSSGVGVTNLGTVTIGSQGSGIDITTPVIRGYSKAVYSASGKTLNIYDGILQSRGSTVLDGTTTNIEPNSQPNTNGTIQIGGVTYNTWYLESTN